VSESTRASFFFMKTAFGHIACLATVQQYIGYRGMADLASRPPGRFMGSRSRSNDPATTRLSVRYFP
jgi:hypothetical protein